MASPAHIGLASAVMATVAVVLAVTLTVIGLDVAGLSIAQMLLEVIMQVTTSPSFSVLEE